jgi:hypothetical protein
LFRAAVDCPLPVSPVSAFAAVAGPATAPILPSLTILPPPPTSTPAPLPTILSSTGLCPHGDWNLLGTFCLKSYFLLNER